MYLFSTLYIVFSSDRYKIQILMLLSGIYGPEGLKKKKNPKVQQWALRNMNTKASPILLTYEAKLILRL